MAKQMEQQQTGGPGYDIPCYDAYIASVIQLSQRRRRL